MTSRHLPLILFNLGWLLAVSIGFVVTVTAQTDTIKVNILEIDNSAYPLVAVQATVHDPQGVALTNLDVTSFEIQELGQPTTAELIAVDNNPMAGMAILLALDTSLGETELAEMKSAATMLINQLGSSDVMALLLFDEQVMTKSLQFTSDKTDLLRQVTDLKAVPASRTAFYDAAIHATKTTSAVSLSQKRRAVIMMTNIGDNVNQTSLETTIRETQTNRVPLYILGFSNRSAVNREALDQLAQATGGQAMLINDATDLTTMLQWLLTVLRQSYRLTFRATAPLDALDPRFTLKVTSLAGDAGEAQGAFTPKANAIQITLLGLSPDQVVINNLALSSQIVAPAHVLSVTYQLDKQPPIQATTPPYSFLLDTSVLSPGSHELRVVAVDAIGNVSDEVTIPFRLPESVGVAPSLRVRLGEPVILQAMTQTTALPHEIEFLFDGVLLGQADDKYQFRFDKENTHYPQKAGLHTITIQMKDSLAQSGQGNLIIEFISTTNTVAIPSWRALVCIAGNIVILFVLGIFWLISRRPKSDSIEALPVLTLSNKGNARSAYDLTAQVVGGFNALRLEFSQATMTQTTVSAAGEVMGQSASQAQSQPHLPSTQGVGSAATDGMNKAKQGLGCFNQIMDVVIGLLELIAIFPVIGRPFLQMAISLRKTQTEANSIAQAPGMMVGQIQNQAQTIKSKAGSSPLGQVSLPNLGRTTSDSSATQTSLPHETAPSPTYSSTSSTPVRSTKVVDLPLKWQEPPFRTSCIEPHDNITIQVRAIAAKLPRKSVSCIVQIQSHAVGDENGLLLSSSDTENIQHELTLGGTSYFRLALGMMNGLALLFIILANGVILYYYWNLFWTTFDLPPVISSLL